MDNVWRFEFVDNSQVGQQDAISTGISNTIESGVNTQGKNSKKTFADTFTQKIENTAIQQAVISPLNTVTGGLASPIYKAGRSIMRGASVGAALGSVGATLAIMAVTEVVNKLQQRMADLETKAINLGNTDNALIRAGSVSKTTYYSANITGIVKTTNRS